MEQYLILKLKDGSYVSDVDRSDSQLIVDRISCDITTVPLGDFGYHDHCMVVKKGDKLGMLFLWTRQPSFIYGSKIYPFKYDRLQIYTGFCDEYAYAVAYEGEEWSILKLTDGCAEDNITIVPREYDNRGPMSYIPADHMVGPSFVPLLYNKSSVGIR